eukprot:TRINITY_DN186_c0_g1_i1.p1 TRINITY_DN186_c0_g1~~TRINITY_DN186_c0_g1_i1.p1  ORF type:complete len:140 (-),score=53.50 TRINITY_DN186_c0_g1_i1:146-529(-)
MSARELKTPKKLSPKAQEQFDEILDALVDLFRRIDKDGKGTMHKNEAKRWFDGLFPDEEPSKDDEESAVDQIFKRLDADNDDHITLKEWVAYWHKRLSRNFKKAGELNLSEQQLQSFLSTIRDGRAL